MKMVLKRERGSQHEDDGDGDGGDGGCGSVGAGTGGSGNGGRRRQRTQAPAANAKAPVDPFPPVNLKNFTAPSPTTAEVNAFLKQAWGFDDEPHLECGGDLEDAGSGRGESGCVCSGQGRIRIRCRGMSFL